MATGSLPRALTTFVGRETELADLVRLVPRAPLVTLVGAPGAGKTRLALEVAARLRDTGAFPDGVAFVPLAPLADAALVLPAIASAVGAREAADIAEAVGGRRLLLVLDNWEHVLAAAPAVAELVSTCPQLAVLATSREPMRVAGERLFEVAPLPLPADDPAAPAVALFADRASAARHGFALDARTLPMVARLCRRLDGLPLAIELAAARVSHLPLDELEARLERPFTFLTVGARGVDVHHRTLEALVAWSHDLLDAEEQRLFRHLGVFAGPFTLEAAEAVAGGEDPERTLDLLGQLVDKSLVVREEGAYRLLETLKAYAGERLAESGEVEALRDSHATYFQALAEETEPRLFAPGGLAWMNRLDLHLADLRSALRWLEEVGRRDDAARMASMLVYFWFRRDHYADWRANTRLLEIAPTGRPRALGLFGIGMLLIVEGKHAESEEAFRRAVDAARAAGDAAIAARGLNLIGLSLAHRGEFPAARARLEQALVAARDAEDPFSTSQALDYLAFVASCLGDLERARPLFEEAIAIERASGNAFRVAFVLNNLGETLARFGEDAEAEARLREAHAIDNQTSRAARVGLGFAWLALRRGDLATARAVYRESMVNFREQRTDTFVAQAAHGLGVVALAAGEIADAPGHLREAMSIRRASGERRNIVETLEALAALAALGRQPLPALRLLGAADAARAAMGAPRFPTWASLVDGWLAPARRALGAASESALAAGRALTLEQACDEAAGLELPASSGPSSPRLSRGSDALTRREREVAALVAQGLSNRAIGERLIITEGTAALHVQHVLGKLGFSSRAQIVAWAIERNRHTGTRAAT